MSGVVHPSWLEVLTDPIRLDVVFALSSLGAGSAGEVARCCHATERTVKRHLDTLVSLGLARESRFTDGERPGRPPTRFILDEKVRSRVTALFVLLKHPLVPSSIRIPESAQDR
jgi:predicted ArsR family transcriptional regulator